MLTLNDPTFAADGDIHSHFPPSVCVLNKYWNSIH